MNLWNQMCNFIVNPETMLKTFNRCMLYDITETERQTERYEVCPMSFSFQPNTNWCSNYIVQWEVGPPLDFCVCPKKLN